MNAKISYNKKIINGELIGDIHVSSSKLKSTSVNKTIVPRSLMNFQFYLLQQLLPMEHQNFLD